MQTIKQSGFLRPISRSSSPAPLTSNRSDAAIATDAPTTHHMVRSSSKGPLNRLSLGSLRGRSPNPKDVASNATTTATLVQDGSYLEALSLKVSEAVSKALSPVPCPLHGATAEDAFNGRKAIPVGRGNALGACIAGELNAAKENPQLYRAIVRLLHRPMSVLLTNLSAQLLPVLSSSKFQQNEPTMAPTGAQLHALAIAGFATEVLVTFDQLGLGVGGLTETRGDGLHGIRQGLEAIIGRVLTPLVANIKQDLLPLIADLEKPSADAWLPSPKSLTTGPLKPTAVNQSFHPCINAIQVRIIAYNKHIQRYQVAGGKACDSQIATLTISLIWRALVALAHRKPKDVAASSPTPPVSGIKKRLTPPTTPLMAIAFKGTISGSRPPSPTVLPPTRAADAKAICDLLYALPRPPETSADACEAITEAFDDLRTLTVLFDTLDTFSGPIDDSDLEVLTNDLPTLIALPALLNSINVESCNSSQDIHNLLGLEEKEYRQTCLPSFGREEECAETVVRKLIEVFSSRGAQDSIILRWLRDQLE